MPESGAWRIAHPEARDRPNRYPQRAALHWMRDRICGARADEALPGHRLRGPAPTLGQHNHELLCDLIGVSEAE